jgi:isoquinoline 1-oxidoreductase beta subunit
MARIGWYRSVINIPHAFAIWSFVDELAQAAGKDPKDFLLDLLGPDRIVDMSKAGLAGKPWNYDRSFEDYPIDTARYRKVAELVAEKSGWGNPLSSGRGRGIPELRGHRDGSRSEFRWYGHDPANRCSH